jgi:hypothetical protein
MSTARCCCSLAPPISAAAASTGCSGRLAPGIQWTRLAWRCRRSFPAAFGGAAAASTWQIGRATTGEIAQCRHLCCWLIDVLRQQPTPSHPRVVRRVIVGCRLGGDKDGLNSVSCLKNALRIKNARGCYDVGSVASLGCCTRVPTRTANKLCGNVCNERGASSRSIGIMFAWLVSVARVVRCQESCSAWHA